METRLSRVKVMNQRPMVSLLTPSVCSKLKVCINCTRGLVPSTVLDLRKVGFDGLIGNYQTLGPDTWYIVLCWT